jgi:hypothetical protein
VIARGRPSRKRPSRKLPPRRPARSTSACPLRSTRLGTEAVQRPPPLNYSGGMSQGGGGVVVALPGRMSQGRGGRTRWGMQGACATAAQHARPHAVRLRAHQVSRSASCRAACCLLANMHRASASTAARTGAEGALSLPCLRRTCCLAWGLSSLSFVAVRIKWPAGRGGMAVRPGKPRFRIHVYSTASAASSVDRGDRKGFATTSM